MIWICTLCLLAIAAWLFFNAMNERQWVKAHSHDETVASDGGLFGGLSTLTGTGALDANGKVSIDQENSGFARAVNKVQQQTSKYGDKFIEAKVAATRAVQGDGSAADEDTFFGRSVAKVGDRVKRMDEKLDTKIKSAAGMVQHSKDALSGEGNLLAQAKHKVAEKSEIMGQKMSDLASRRQAARDATNNDPDATGDEGKLGQIVGKVSGGLTKMEGKLEEQIAKGRAHVASKRTEISNQDLLGKVTAKVGATVNELEKKLPGKNRNSGDS